ncbi:hypothetical protein GALL_216690 [mine drainage metagenome]|uniref:Uncharacterized protein n=1 Tax=mine drainage metagenome TaxID=410659 RepID=A0A1J5RJM9_9ZZZZ
MIPALAQVVLGELLGFLFCNLARLEQVVLLLDDAHARIHQRLERLLFLFHHVRTQTQHRISTEQHQPQQHAAEQQI